MSVGTKIRGYRISKGITQLDLEIGTKLAHGVISRIENNRTNPSKETIIRIAKELELQNQEIAELFGLNFKN